MLLCRKFSRMLTFYPIPFQKSLQCFRWLQERRRLKDIELYMSCFHEVKRKMDLGIAKPCMSMRM